MNMNLSPNQELIPNKITSENSPFTYGSDPIYLLNNNNDLN